MIKFKRPDYCAQPTVESCQVCSLVNYGRDCQNNVLPFDDKPDAELRAELKKHGFKWAPSNQAWQRFRSPDAMYYAKQIVGIN